MKTEEDIKKLRELRFWLCTLAALAFGACALYPLHKIEWLSQLGALNLFVCLLCAISIDVKLPREKYRELDLMGGDTVPEKEQEQKEEQEERVELWIK